MAVSCKVYAGRGVNSSSVTERGLIGDRSYALIDQETGKVASAKNPRKWGKLFDFRAAFIDSPHIAENIPPVRVTVPDGAHIFSDQDNIDYTLSKVLGRDVRLMSASLEKPRYEEVLAGYRGPSTKREGHRRSHASPNFLRYCCNPSVDDLYDQSSARTLSRWTFRGSTL